MTDDAPQVLTLDEAAQLLHSRAGGYLRNSIRIATVSCEVCTAPVDGWPLCFQCNQRRMEANLADACGFLTYALEGAQSAHNMFRYKDRLNSEHARQVVNLVLGLGLIWHEACASRLPGATPLTHWSTVSSLKGREGQHPLRVLAAKRLSHPYLELIPRDTGSPRSFNVRHFEVDGPVPRGSHVLLVEDSWVGGGHAQSAAAALKLAGADRVSILTVARWVKPTFASHGEWVRTYLGRDYDPHVCPWTGGDCPSLGV